MSRRTWMASVVCALFGVAAGATAQTQKQMVVVPSDQAKFVPVDPARPDGAAIAVLWGDPATAPSAMLLKMKKGPGQPHFHTSDYHLVVLTGAMTHVGAGVKEREAARLGPGSYWFQPGRQNHTDSCLTDECVMFITWAGKRDGFPAQELQAR